MKRNCARCGIEFETNNNAYYCQDCAPLHRAELNMRMSREHWKNRNHPKAPKGDGRSINDVLKLAPTYGLSTYEYGMTVLKMKEGH